MYNRIELWHILQIETKLKEIFAGPPLLAFKRNKNLKDIGGNKAFDNKKNLNVKKFTKRKCQPCFTKSIKLYCKLAQPLKVPLTKTPF